MCPLSLVAAAAAAAVTRDIDTSKAVHVADPRLVSFTLDLWHTRSGWGGLGLDDPAVRALAAQLSPAYLRLGGTAQDNLTYDMSPAERSTPAGASSAGPGKSIPAATLTAALWDEMNAFVGAAQFDAVFGLNMLQGWDASKEHGWDSADAETLIRYTKQKGYNVVGWELGNEPNLNNKGGDRMTPALLGARFGTLRSVLQGVYATVGGGNSSSPYIIGPDVTNGALDSFLPQFLDAVSQPVDAITWHHYYVAGAGNQCPTKCVDDFADPAFLNKFVAKAGDAASVTAAYRAAHGAELWLGETSGAGGATAGAKDVRYKFIGVFWYADKLGSTAAAGHRVVARQSLTELIRADPVEATPAYWLALLWKRNVGRNVLSVAGNNSGEVRVYAHAREYSDAKSVGVVIINLAASAQEVGLTFAGAARTSSPHGEYHLTAWPDAANMSSTGIALNGKKLDAGSGGSLPALEPQRSSAAAVTVAARSVAFVTYPL